MNPLTFFLGNIFRILINEQHIIFIHLLLIRMCPDFENPFIMSFANDGSAANRMIAHNPVRVEWMKDVKVFRHFH